MNVAVVGATGYGSGELVRILSRHPHVKIHSLVSSSRAGERLGTVFPHLAHLEHTLEEWNVDKLAKQVDVVFFAAPAGVSSEWLPPLAEEGVVAIDLAGDFRLEPEVYQQWYGQNPPPTAWLNQAQYGLSEWNAEAIAQADVIANPGCYPTAALLALLPLVQAGALEATPLVIDGKSGISGAGRGLKLGSLFGEVEGNVFSYKVGKHQHTPEMERILALWGKESHRVIFTPQIVPMSRGILVTGYGKLRQGWSEKDLRDCWKAAYEQAPFIRLLEEDRWPRTKEVRGSNFCDLQLHVDHRTGHVVLAAAIDNLVKGAAGQAVQNLNLRMGWPETAGLTMDPLFP
ncbi:N-acetyl-gamma-glutamyl-phosphate reductase [Desmospora profundinema]|uniref:N-acetyl-gamma-glutamyl-phosphate reductase n=1 Tax=Desmospora profundinema TaxID=1571184 RepID=A0ABU1IN27_9BACL|nr:N-acetyl-gamma-glutamyl-phosphate reductase [Desmospora profundinema]MDR6225579.1 N-acetyl-gamma-glutamyl-phosphate reductase [Desmospora profundinema]